MVPVTRSRLAGVDLFEILGELDASDSARAERYADLFYEKVESLARFPEMGRPRPEFGTDVRSTLIKPYILFYRYNGEAVQVLRIVHGKRDLRQILEGDVDE
jgi:toxin ParE1/3/4